MSYTFLAPTVLVLGALVTLGNDVASNARDLRKLLMAGHRPATIEAAHTERGCGPVDCTIDIDGLSILRERKVIQQAGGSRIRMKQHGPGDPKELPEMDWELIEGFKVFRAGRRWGTCLEFGHTGLGKSGRFQRWSSVVLVPWKGSRPSAGSHRFVGYWAGCDSLAEGVKAGEVILPVVEPVAIGASRLHIAWHHCTAERCIQVEDPRIVSGDPGSEKGALVINGK